MNNSQMYQKNMLDNRGQSLVMFVLTLPIVVMIMFLVIDIGKMILLRQTLDNINYLALDYGLDKFDEPTLSNQIKEIIYKNKADIDTVEVSIQDNKIMIELDNKIDLILFKDNHSISVKSSYVGYLNNDKKIIERNK